MSSFERLSCMLLLIYFIFLLLFSAVIRIDMVILLPWKKSAFYTVSKGFPTMSTLQLTLSVKAIQTLVSVTCQIHYTCRHIHCTIQLECCF
jgi:hypothetical protein